MDHKYIEDRKFLAWMTLFLIGASLWIFRSYLHYLVVGAVLALATSHVFSALSNWFSRTKFEGIIYKSRDGLAALILTLFFLLMIFTPLVYFVSMTLDQMSGLDMAQIKQTLTELIDKTVLFLDKIPILRDPLARLRTEGVSFVSGPALEVIFDSGKGLVIGVGGLVGQIVWILLFFFLFNLYGRQILQFLANLVPMSGQHQRYLYQECSGTVAVVFYGTLFNMIAQGIAFGLLMSFVGNYDAVYLGVLAGFCSVVPIVGAALVYVPVLALELLAGHFVNVIVILLFAWVVMGFVIDNILRLIFIGVLKKMFGFKYTMNDILILLAILAGISAFGFWGLVIGPSVLALTLASANLYSGGLGKGKGDLEETSSTE